MRLYLAGYEGGGLTTHGESRGAKRIHEELQVIRGNYRAIEIPMYPAMGSVEACELITEAMAGAPGLLLGGDHTVTYGALAALRDELKRPLRIMVVDAHSDCQPSNDEHDPPLSAASWMRCALEDDVIESAILIGHRQLDTMPGVNVWGFWNAAAIDFGVIDYFSIDLDGIDPSFAPGVSWPEYDGLSPKDVVELINQCKKGGCYGFDITEYNPSLDAGVVTARLAARLAEKILFKPRR